MQKDGGVVIYTDMTNQNYRFSQNISTEILRAKWIDHLTIPSFVDKIFFHSFLLLFVLNCSKEWLIKLNNLTSYDVQKTNYD
jgi:hypothetical protein